MNQYNLVLIEHKVENERLYQRAFDGYVNATAMCDAAGKNFDDYTKTQNYQGFITQLSSVTRIPVTELVQVIQGGEPQLQGTWVHPQVAINLAQWCSPVFAVQVSQFVTEWIQGNNPAQKLIQHWQFYLARTSILHNSVPDGYFSVFHEAAPMIVAMIQSGVVVDAKTVPDISIGQHWSKYWNSNLQNYHDKPISYNHYYPDIFPQATSNPQESKAYPDTAIPDFRKWMRDEYLPNKFPNYIGNKQKKGDIGPETANKLIDTFAPKKLK